MMQVFLPYPDLERSVCCLDPKRLGNQVYRECKTLILGGWPNHPVARMWMGYKPTLALYALFGIQELRRRGYIYPYHERFFQQFLAGVDAVLLPSWLGMEKLHASHRAALLYKNPEWYGQFRWKERPAAPDARGRLNYFWPSHIRKKK